MMKRNFELLMQEQMKKVNVGTKLLLHSCCAPCSSACLERLKDTFDITPSLVLLVRCAAGANPFQAGFVLIQQDFHILQGGRI